MSRSFLRTLGAPVSKPCCSLPTRCAESSVQWSPKQFWGKCRCPDSPHSQFIWRKGPRNLSLNKLSKRSMTRQPLPFIDEGEPARGSTPGEGLSGVSVEGGTPLGLPPACMCFIGHARAFSTGYAPPLHWHSELPEGVCTLSKWLEKAACGRTQVEPAPS